ncbi:MAG: lipoyl(octanoyl) transferase LipB [Trueperaceae bacterium]
MSDPTPVPTPDATSGPAPTGNRGVAAPYEVVDLGRLGYREAWDLQHTRHDAVARREAPPAMFWVEHDPVLTFGRKGGRDHLLASETELRARGFDLVDVERGGDVTYHGPGQLVGYPILPVGRRVRAYLRAIEDAMVELCAGFGIDAFGSPGYAGVWVGDRKVCAIGVAIRRDVSFHGFALNVATDLRHFETIVPCGLHDRGVTSLTELLGRPIGLEEAQRRLTPLLHEHFAPFATPRRAPAPSAERTRA